MIDLRESVITIIDPKVMFGVEKSTPTHIIILDMGDGGYIGISVDKVCEIIDVNDDEIVDTKQVLGKGSQYIDLIINKIDTIYNNLSVEKLEEFYNGNH
jgi:chemotaxis signal transduction protein